MIKVANAPCSCGVLEFELDGEAAGYKQVLDEIGATQSRLLDEHRIEI
jgi:inosose dehydratase